MTKILIVDDDVALTELLAQLLTLEGFVVDVARNGQDALNKLDESYNIVLLDVMMPMLNGVDTLKQIRQRSSVPVIMLTARSNEIDKVIGLELGADDYLSKPFHDRELIARIKAVLRRSTLTAESEEKDSQESDCLIVGELELNPSSQQVKFRGELVELTSSEFLLLYGLASSAGKAISREELSQKVLGKKQTLFDRAIDMHMSNLRHKLPPRSDNMPWVKTLRGRGYVFISD